MAAGVRPNIRLAPSAGLSVNRGIIVNQFMQTNKPNVYAVGECAEHDGIVYGLAPPLYEQGKVLAQRSMRRPVRRVSRLCTICDLKNSRY